MPFTVVQTLEDGKNVLCCVPEGWVNNNYLAWPRKKADKLTKSENSLPGPDWFLMPCSVKRSGLTFQEGQLAVTIMTEITDTEEDEHPTKIKEERKVSKVKSHNDILEKCLEKAAIKSINPLQQPNKEAQIKPLESLNDMPSLEAPFFLQNKKENVTTSTLIDMEVTEKVGSNQEVEYIIVPEITNITTKSNNDITEKIESLTVTVNAIENNQKELLETQQQLLLRMISMQAQFEEFLRRTQQENLRKEIGFNPINSLESLQKLDDTLKDDRSTTELINKFSLVCGTVRAKV